MTKEVTETKSDSKYELIPLEEKSLLQLYTDGTIDSVVTEIRNRVSSFEPDMTTNKGRKEIASLARKVASSKTYLDDLGKSLSTPWKQKAKVVDEQRKKVKDELDALKHEIRKPLTEWEQKEKDRVASLEARIEKIKRYGQFEEDGIALTLDQLEARYKELTDLVIDEKWDEFKDAAYKERVSSLTNLEVKLIKLKQEKEAKEKEEAERKAKEEAERKAQEAQRIKEAEERVRKEAEEKALAEKEKARIEREEAEKKAIREKEEAEARIKKAEEDALRIKREAQEREERFKKEAEERAQKQKQEELNRVRAEEQKKREDAIRKQEAEEARARDKDHRASTNRKIVEDLIACSGISNEQARKVVVAIVKGGVHQTTIKY